MYIHDKPRKTIRAPTVSFSSRTAPTHLRSRHKRSCKVSKPIDFVPSPNSGDRQPPKQNRQTVTFVKRNTPTSIHQLHNPAPPARSAKVADAHFHNYHLIYNHTQPRTLHQMAKEHLLPHLPPELRQTPPKITCSSCAHAKQRPKPHKRRQHNYAVAVAMSSDICGPISPPSRQGNKYFMTLIDTKSRYLIVDFMPNRQGVDLRMKNIISKIRSTHHNAAKNLTTDNAKEYLSKAATTIYSIMRINHSTSLPYTPQQNGIAERINPNHSRTSGVTPQQAPPHFLGGCSSRCGVQI